MTLSLLVKMATTAVVVIGVTLAVARLGPRLGGVIAGTPIVLGPAFFFLGLERSAGFVAEAALAAIHALTATLVFLITYVAVAGRLGPVTSLLAAVTAWGLSATAFATLPGGYPLGLVVYVLVFGLALAARRWLRLSQPRVQAPNRWLDLLLRGLAAGVLVGVATTVAATAGPKISGTLTGFPVGFTVIALTLHQRFGAPVARATLAAAQGGMFSLVAFAVAAAATAPALGGMGAFWLALGSSLAVSAGLFALSHFTDEQRPRRGREAP
ncbi:MAG: hypothetical protein U5L11_07060 [Arhodomonas sp.]|nr:hypothetical protein [Arhodomonas sp.]